MSAKKAWILYTFLRIVFFVIPFAIIMLLLPRELVFSLNWAVVFAVLAAAAISLALSILFLSKLRERAALGIVEWRERAHTADAEVEDAAVASEQENSETTR